jgi:uncharacterized protein (TIGR02452 family)
VFCDDDGDLLGEPSRCAFVTSPAVNAGAMRVKARGVIPNEMRERIRKVPHFMAGHGHDAAVLRGGCGVFRNNPEVIADLFREALVTRFAGVYRKVVFAIPDWSAERRFIEPFDERFG